VNVCESAEAGETEVNWLQMELEKSQWHLRWAAGGLKVFFDISLCANATNKAKTKAKERQSRERAKESTTVSKPV
jgi:hypothetical protein